MKAPLFFLLAMASLLCACNSKNQETRNLDTTAIDLFKIYRGKGWGREFDGTWVYDMDAMKREVDKFKGVVKIAIAVDPANFKSAAEFERKLDSLLYAGLEMDTFKEFEMTFERKNNDKGKVTFKECDDCEEIEGKLGMLDNYKVFTISALLDRPLIVPRIKGGKGTDTIRWETKLTFKNLKLTRSTLMWEEAVPIPLPGRNDTTLVFVHRLMRE
jgi:hypothetical protein